MQWINVKDRLPEPNVRVLVLRDAGHIITNKLHKGYPNRFWCEISSVNEGNNYFTCELIDTGITSQWMPLPEPTNAEND